MPKYINYASSGISSYEILPNGTLILEFDNGDEFSYAPCVITSKMIGLAKSGHGLQTFINKNRSLMKRVHRKM